MLNHCFLVFCHKRQWWVSQTQTVTCNHSNALMRLRLRRKSHLKLNLEKAESWISLLKEQHFYCLFLIDMQWFWLILHASYVLWEPCVSQFLPIEPWTWEKCTGPSRPNWNIDKQRWRRAEQFLAEAGRSRRFVESLAYEVSQASSLDQQGQSQARVTWVLMTWYPPWARWRNMSLVSILVWFC